jgi:hypothetical protein
MDGSSWCTDMMLPIVPAAGAGIGSRYNLRRTPAHGFWRKDLDNAGI